MKKIPWGVFAGVCAIIWSFVTIAIVAVNVISGMMIADAGTDGGLSESWWIPVLYVVDAIAIALCIAMSVLYFVRERKRKKQAKYAEGGEES